MVRSGVKDRAALGPARATSPAGAFSAAATPLLPHDRGLRHAVETHLLEEIRTGRLQPGGRLYEAAIAETLGVSLTPVREALFRFVHDGLVVHLPRRGFYLAEFGQSDVEDIYVFRAMLEGLAAARAAVRITPPELAALEQLIDDG